MNRHMANKREPERLELYRDMQAAIAQATRGEAGSAGIDYEKQRIRVLLAHFTPRQLIGLRAHLGVEPPFPTHLSDHPDPYGEAQRELAALIKAEQSVSGRGRE